MRLPTLALALLLTATAYAHAELAPSAAVPAPVAPRWPLSLFAPRGASWELDARTDDVPASIARRRPRRRIRRALHLSNQPPCTNNCTPILSHASMCIINVDRYPLSPFSTYSLLL
ncbi:hypothetical protein OF83DRAFT_1177065 [Amylostereum chailletii]|nr:hypothetical protein OF83DRAFT_1177065 [Amylostereum chailletii]